VETVIRVLRRSDDRSGFGCGDSELDRYFHRFAGQNQFRHHVGVTYVAVEGIRIRGFLTVSPGEIASSKVPARLLKGLPAYPLPALRVARLAVDQRDQGQGVGGMLLRFLFELTVKMRDELGCVGVVVDSKPDAVAFYETYGFQATTPESGTLGDRPAPTVMFLPVASIG